MAKAKGKKKGKSPEKGKELSPELAQFLSAGNTDADEGEETGADESTTATDSKKKKGKGKGKGSKRSKGSKGKKGKKKKKKAKEESTPTETKPQYTQKDIDDYLRAKEKKKRKQREMRLVEKMQSMISLVRSNDPRWTTWTLAPLYKFLRIANVEVATIFLRKFEAKEDKKLAWAEEDDDEDLRRQTLPLDKRRSSRVISTRYSTHKKPVEDVSGSGSRTSIFSGVESGRVEKASVSRLSHVSKTHVPGGGGGGPKTVDGYQLIVVNDVVPNHSPDMFYFVKLRPVMVDRDNFFEDVLFGNIPGGYLTSLHSLMSYVLTPMFYQNGVLPESIANDFYASTNSFMSSITETHNRLLCQTVLYVPKEALSAPIDIVSKDKEICSRLEAAMVHWIRQIQEVVSNQTMSDSEDWSGPLDEIAFWQTRNEDLAGLAAQLKSTPVRTVRQIMTIIKSPFITSFNAIASEILGAEAEAISNLHYLNVLVEPCTKLHNSKVAEIPDQLQNILWLIRVIWLNSPFYNSRDRLNSLLRKVSSEIISHCIKEIDVDQVFNGHIATSEELINQCVDCLKLWKTKYFEAQKMHNMNSYMSWLLEYDYIMSHVDVFLHRLKDLLEICVCQRLYARRVAGYQEPLPRYPGVKGPEITRVMKKVQKLLDRNLKDMYTAQDLILNVRNTQWHDYMVMFRNAIRDIETMIQNVLFLAFDSVENIEQGIQLMEVFYVFVFYDRSIIVRAYDKLIMKFYKIFEDEISSVRSLFNEDVIPLPAGQPRLAERGMRALELQKRLDLQLEMLKEAAWWLPECGYGDDIKEQAHVLSKTLEETAQVLNQGWLKVLGPNNLYPHLDIPLMTRSTSKFGMIEINFDKMLAVNILQAELWESIGFPIPDVLWDVFYERKRLQEMRETVQNVVTDYNSIISSLSVEERQLFRERIKVLDRKIYPGLTKLIWSSDVSESYTRDCRMAATTVANYITDYKNANIKIGKLATKISNYVMIKVDPKQIFEKADFNDYQDTTRFGRDICIQRGGNVQCKIYQLQSALSPLRMQISLPNVPIGRSSKAILKIAMKYKDITEILRDVFEMFKTDGPEVKNQWMKYLKKIDTLVEEALCLNMRQSLQILHHTVHGDLRGPPPPIFKLVVTLDEKLLDFDPPVPVVEDMILGIYRRICISIAPFPRVIQFLTDPDAQVTSFAQVIAKDEVCRATQDRIADGMRICVTEIEKYLQSCEPYRDVWELDKNVFMELYEKQNPATSSYDTDIGRYSEVLDVVQGCESIVTVTFCTLDCTTLQEILSEHCREWQSRLLTSLFQRGAVKLAQIYSFMEESLSKFTKAPKTLSDLINAVSLFREVQAAVTTLERSFPKVFEHFDVLDKYEFDVGSQIQDKLSTFDRDWHKDLTSLKNVEEMLRSAKEKMKKLVTTMAEEFKTKVDELVESFGAVEWGMHDPETAIEELQKCRATVIQLKKDEVDLVNSLTIFKLDMAASDDLKKLEKELVRYENLLGVQAGDGLSITASTMTASAPPPPPKAEKTPTTKTKGKRK